MAKLIITNGDGKETQVNGRMTFKASKVFDEEGNPMMVCLGQLTTHKYFEEIKKIESDRYILENVEVTDETFGTNDFDILYDFQVNNLGWNVKEEYLSKEIIEKIELDLYKEDEGDSYILLEEGCDK